MHKYQTSIREIVEFRAETRRLQKDSESLKLIVTYVHVHNKAFNQSQLLKEEPVCGAASSVSTYPLSGIT